MGGVVPTGSAPGAHWHAPKDNPSAAQRALPVVPPLHAQEYAAPALHRGVPLGFEPAHTQGVKLAPSAEHCALPKEESGHAH